ncbi:TetR/AcrR family transcriptional regulator [Limibacillus sp. MBR-115]|jgi:AcrR family transcriptional regulator|uniref:TetR/AcrR family transcriptional regulator n=1 Tax=Limibacillus sp. MBR-115 TaxID=3156465 RepID=UPI00339466EC
MTLREKQKARRYREIINAAAMLFGKHGYSNTTIEDIAEQAFVAPGTVYNYFGTKDGILQGIVEMHITERRAERRSFLKAPPADFDEAIVVFVSLLIDRAFVLVNREIWRQILASSISRGGSPEDFHDDVTGALVNQFERMFKTFQKRGCLRADVDLKHLSEAAMGIADFHFYRYVCQDNGSITDAKLRIVRQIQMLVEGLRQPPSPNISARPTPEA